MKAIITPILKAILVAAINAVAGVLVAHLAHSPGLGATTMAAGTTLAHLAPSPLDEIK